MADQTFDIKGGHNQIVPNAREATTNIYTTSRPSRLESYFQRLMEEIKKNVVTEEVIDDLIYYNTKLDGTKDVEEKLRDGGFKESRIQEAVRLKEVYAKQAMRYDCYPSAQQIILVLFARIKREFETSIEPMIEDEAPLREVMQAVRSKIVSPIMQTLETDGSLDKYLQFTEDHVYGMIYYLTGMCHLNWKDYDNV